MTALLWAAIGITIGAAVLYATLGMRRPLDRAYLSFAFMMALLAVYFYFRLDLYRATTTDGSVEAVRRQVLMVLGCHGCLLVFVPAYTRVRIPRLLMAAYWGGLAIFFLANLWAPYGLLFSGQPELVRSAFRGEPYYTVVAPPMSTDRLTGCAVIVGGFGAVVTDSTAGWLVTWPAMFVISTV